MKTGRQTTGALTYDERSFFLQGQRRFLVSGEIHSSRAPRDEWPRILDAAAWSRRRA